MANKDYVYNPEEQTMVFSVDTKRHVRVGFADGRVWYAATDVARLLGYRDPSKAANVLNCEIRILHVPHVSPNRNGITTCNCIGKKDLLTFINTNRASQDIREWIQSVLIPQSEMQFFGKTPVPNTVSDILSFPATPAKMPAERSSLVDALDKFIIAAVSLRQELQAK